MKPLLVISTVVALVALSRLNHQDSVMTDTVCPQENAIYHIIPQSELCDTAQTGFSGKTLNHTMIVL
jgi:hypothetical protein